MIARVWSGTATDEGADQYVVHFRETVRPGLEALEGFRGAHVLRRDVEGLVEIRVLTLWSSIEAIRAFAGDDLTTAVVEPAAQAVLASYDTTVALYEVAE